MPPKLARLFSAAGMLNVVAAYASRWSTGPWGLAESRGLLYVASFGSDQVLVFDLASGKFLDALGDRSNKRAGARGPHCAARACLRASVPACVVGVAGTTAL